MERFWAGSFGRRIHFPRGGDLREQLLGPEAVITINSTTGPYAPKRNRSAIVLGRAVHDIPGLIHQGTLADFWTNPEKTDTGLLTSFITALAWATQLSGGA